MAIKVVAGKTMDVSPYARCYIFWFEIESSFECVASDLALGFVL